MRRILSVLLLLLVPVSVGIGQRKLSASLASLVEAERAFARTSVEKGVRESFLMFFADDGINFQLHPTKTREALLKRPAPATPVKPNDSRQHPTNHLSSPNSILKRVALELF